MPTATRRFPHPLLFAIVGIALGIAFAVFTVASWRADDALDDRGRETTGRVVQVRERAWPKDPRIKVEFTTADGRTEQAWINGDRGRASRVGQEVRVVYDPRDPTGNVADARRPGRTPFLLIGVTAVFLLGAPAFAWFVVRPARRASTVHRGR